MVRWSVGCNEPPDPPEVDPRGVFDRIVVDPRVCEGKPTIRHTRITVDFLLKLLGDGYTADEIVRECPELEKEDVYQAAKYGSWLAADKLTRLCVHPTRAAWPGTAEPWPG